MADAANHREGNAMPIVELDKPIVGSDVSEALRLEDNPFAPSAHAGAPRAGANMYGAFSLEAFCGAGGLSYTHEDAGGWLAYVEKFTPRNFWYKDQNVKPWAYYED